MTKLSVYMVTSTLLLLSPLAAFASTPNLNPNIYSADSSPYGIPYGEWMAKWWQWNLGIPAGEHPSESLRESDQLNPSQCAVNQEGPVWFLPDAGGEKGKTISCNIPADKSIILPLSNGESDPTDPCASDPGRGPDLVSRITDCALYNRADQEFLKLKVDGKDIRNFEELYRSKSGFFNVTIPEDATLAIEGVKPGTYGPALTEGYFLFLKPLSLGPHSIEYEFEESLKEESVPGPVQDFANLPKLRSASYNLTAISPNQSSTSEN
jgi:hypothetical protein